MDGRSEDNLKEECPESSEAKRKRHSTPASHFTHYVNKFYLLWSRVLHLPDLYVLVASEHGDGGQMRLQN